MPNPFYQIYEGAALLAGAEPYLAGYDGRHGVYAGSRCCAGGGLAAVSGVVSVQPGESDRRGACRWSICSGRWSLLNGMTSSLPATSAIRELYLDESSPPPGLLQACRAVGNDRFERCVVFHSLSKRSSVPGLRSGFVAGDPEILKRFLLYRTYHGSAMAVPTQLASIAAWREDGHAAENRRLYQEKFERVMPILAPVMKVEKPAGAFYLWPDVGGDDERVYSRVVCDGRISRCCRGVIWRVRRGVAGSGADARARGTAPNLQPGRRAGADFPGRGRAAVC